MFFAKHQGYVRDKCSAKTMFFCTGCVTYLSLLPEYVSEEI